MERVTREMPGPLTNESLQSVLPVRNKVSGPFEMLFPDLINHKEPCVRASLWSSVAMFVEQDACNTRGSGFDSRDHKYLTFMHA